MRGRMEPAEFLTNVHLHILGIFSSTSWHLFSYHCRDTLVVTDYSGQGVPRDAKNNSITHKYLASPSLADDVFYSVQAAQSAFPELSKDFVVIGHFEGGGAVWASAQRQVKEPASGYLGAVVVSLVTNVLEERGPEAAVLAVAIAPGIAVAIPGFETTDIQSQ